MRVLGGLLLCLFLAALAVGADTGGYRGPNGDGVFPATGLLKEWPKEGPGLLWKANLGEGYAGPTVQGDTVYLPAGTQGVLHAYTLDGQPRMKLPFGSCTWKRWSGTRSTPLVTGDVAVCTTPGSSIVGLDLKTGEQKWTVNAWKSFGSGKTELGWGYAESPVLAGDNVIFNCCSRDDASPPFVAVDVNTGKTTWQADQGKEKRYSAGSTSGTLIHHGGKAFFVGLTWRYVCCLDPDTGKTVWEIPTNLPAGSSKTGKPGYHNGFLFVDLGGRLQMVKLSDDGRSFMPLWTRSGISYVQYTMLGNRLYIPGDADAATCTPRVTARRGP